MARIARSDRIWRVLKFLLGLQEPHAFEALRRRGMTAEVVGEAVNLMAQATRLEPAGPQGKNGPDHLVELDAFENLWVPICAATLKRHYPEVHEWWTAQVQRQSGKGVVFSVRRFLQGYQDLANGSSPFAQEAQPVLALLAERGLTDAVIDDANEQLAEALQFVPRSSRGEATREATRQRKEAERKLWEWYVEWSAIARATIARPASLRALGLRSRRSKKSPAPSRQVDALPRSGSPVPQLRALQEPAPRKPQQPAALEPHTESA